jgi:hypothetical protein
VLCWHSIREMRLRLAAQRRTDGGRIAGEDEGWREGGREVAGGF